MNLLLTTAEKLWWASSEKQSLKEYLIVNVNLLLRSLTPPPDRNPGYSHAANSLSPTIIISMETVCVVSFDLSRIPLT